MAYTSLAQTGAEATDNEDSPHKYAFATTPSPTIPEVPIAPFSLDFDLVPGKVAVDDPTATSPPSNSKVSKLFSSLTSGGNSYDLVEDDDYEETQITPTVEKHGVGTVAGLHAQQSLVEDFPQRTASISRQLPLNHPKPDLQSLQGAYVRNVERLEETAERLSMTSSLEGEIQKMKMLERQKERAGSTSSRGSQGSKVPQVPATALSGSIIDVNATARSGGYSPAGYITSPVGSIRSARAGPSSLAQGQLPVPSRVNQSYQGPLLEFQSLADDLTLAPFQPHSVPGPPQPVSRSASDASQHRPSSAGSGDTYQQANTLFTDFDGVHYSAATSSRRIPLNRPPHARDSKALREPQPGEEMIYYPAPVPVMLNLPVRLSKMHWNERDKRRLQALGDMPDDARKSAPWLANEDVATPGNRQSGLRLPPQLRASAFFDHKGMEQNVQLKNGSAVATLDSILDAAAHAPVSAFTDHPIVGHLGSEFYGSSAPVKKPGIKASAKKAKKKTNPNSALKTRDSHINISTDDPNATQPTSGELPKADDLHDDAELQEEKEARSVKLDKESEVGDNDDDDDDDNDEESASEADEFEEESHDLGFSAAPTTLLAELQMRKAQQKQRNRTAADAFPNGMHSTLLELDTVTQLQQRARKQKHITLAWEDHEQVDKENFDDDDVPLGLLFSEKERKDHVNVHRPLGLMERRELEENEPLSSRRARLRGEPAVPPPASISPALVTPADDVPRLEAPTLEDHPEETLAQRVKRLREMKENGTTSDFTRELTGELGLPVEEPEPPMTKTPEVEETLGQRRYRLKEEALKQGTSENAASRLTLQPSRSMADLLARNPVVYVHPNEAKTAAVAMQSYQQQMNKNSTYLAQQQAAAAMMNPAYNQLTGGALSPNPYATAYGYNGQVGAGAGAGMHTSMAGYGMQLPMNTNVAMNMNMNMNMNMHGMNPAYAMQSYPTDPNQFAFGPPLNEKQRAIIDRWRQGIA